MNKKQTILLLFLILLFGTFLRFYNLSGEGLWVDEGAMSLPIVRYNLNEIWSNINTHGQTLPDIYKSNTDLHLYFTILELWSRLFGTSEAALRSLSALAGSLSLVVIYLLASELYNRKAGLVSVFISSLSLPLIEYSQELKFYSLIIFSALLSGYFIIKSIRTNKTIYAIGFFLSTIFGIYMNYPFILFVFFEGVYLLYIFVSSYLKSRPKKINDFKKFFLKSNPYKTYLAYVLILFSYIPLLPRMLNITFVSAHFSGQLTMEKLLKLFLQFNSWIYPSQELNSKIAAKQFGLFSLSEYTLIASVFLITAVLAIFFIVGVLKSKGRGKESSRFLLFWVAVPLIMVFIVAYRTIASFGSARYVIFIVPAYLILTSKGILNMKRKFIIGFIFVFIALNLLPIHSYYSNVNNPQYREAAGFLYDNSEKDDTILFNIYSMGAAFEYYEPGLKNTFGVNNVHEAADLASGRDSVWLVRSLTKYSDQEGEIKKHFDDNYRLADTKKFFEVELFHYVK